MVYLNSLNTLYGNIPFEKKRSFNAIFCNVKQGLEKPYRAPIIGFNTFLEG